MNIVIIGGSKGIGAATAIELSRQKSNTIMVTGRDATALKKLSEASVSDNIKSFVSDVSLSPESLTELKTHLKQSEITIDALVITAGQLYSFPFEQTDIDAARKMMEVNFFGPAITINEFIPFMKRDSHIVNIGSMGGFQGSVKFPGLSWYSASKAAIANMTESLATELSHLDIKVNCICPGAVQTEMLENAFPGYQAPVTATEMAQFLSWFTVNGHNFFNGKVLPASISTP